MHEQRPTRLVLALSTLLSLSACHQSQDNMAESESQPSQRQANTSSSPVIGKDLAELPELPIETTVQKPEPAEAAPVAAPSSVQPLTSGLTSTNPAADPVAAKRRKLQAVSLENETLAHRIRELEAELEAKERVSREQNRKIDALKP